MEKFKRKSGFTLIELLIVIGIIGILAAVAIPYYQGYIIRSRLTEVENAISLVKSAVTNYYQDTEGIWPNCPTINEVRNSLGVGLGSIDRISGLSINNGEITATIQNIDPMVNGKFIRITPIEARDGSLRWVWGWSPDFPVHLRPKMN